jgi:Mn2+/Fe2+ NRAMP family transporter
MPVTEKPTQKPRSILTKLVNGFIVGNADNEPAGISTYTITGAQTGLSLALFHILSTPLLINAQAICARIGDVTKKGLATNLRLYYGKLIALISMIFVLLANTATLGANFAGIAAGLNLIFPEINILFFLPLVAAILWSLVVFKSYQFIARVLAGMGIIFVSYIITAFLVRPNWGEVIREIFLPHLGTGPQFWLVAIAMLGTTITPFLFYWQVTEEVEDHPTVRDVKAEIGQVSWGLLFANLISTFIIITSALTLYRHGIQVNSAAEAAEALEPFAGRFASLLFALGFIGSGFLAVPVLTSTSAYTMAETFGWKTGLNQKINQARGFYTVLTLSFFVGLAIALLQINPIKILFYSQVLNGLITPFILGMVIKIASKAVILKQYTIGPVQKILGWVTVGVMVLAAIAAFIPTF